MMQCISAFGGDKLSDFDVANRLLKWDERVTGAPKMIDSDHAYIHEGDAYQANVYSSATAGVKRYALVTDATKYVHFRPTQIAIPSGNCILSLFETTVTSSGSAVVPAYNRNRVSTKTAASVLFSGATSTSGTLLDRFAVYGGTGPGTTKSGASDGAKLEWVLRRGTGYRIQLETTVAFNMNLFWYEEADG
jgi:hypothetical protein